MSIKLNTWYRFHTSNDQRRWLDLAETLCDVDKASLLARDMLQLKAAGIRGGITTYTVCYRTYFNAMYCSKWEWYEPNNKNILDKMEEPNMNDKDFKKAQSFFEKSITGQRGDVGDPGIVGPQGLRGIPGPEGPIGLVVAPPMSLIGLIETYGNRAAKELYDKRIKEKANVIHNSDIAKSLEEAANLIMQRSIKATISFDKTEWLEQIISLDYLSDEDKKKLKNIDDSYDEQREVLQQTCNELKALVGATNNFEQAYALLIAYGVVEQKVMFTNIEQKRSIEKQ